jgi:hypothetical protein
MPQYVFSLTTMRIFQPVDLRPYPGILSYLKRIGERDAVSQVSATLGYEEAKNKSTLSA